ncbi:MAG: hypothetical protein KatS3mg101_0376 [Patescibacteria group bacterium]|nr:MAG: hypothetical protein KatS3mg101_0376 [Patescibacteria group bacterium]
MGTYSNFFRKEGKVLRPFNIPTVDANLSRLYETKPESISSLFDNSLEQTEKPLTNFFTKRLTNKLNLVASLISFQKYAAMGFATALIIISSLTVYASVFPRKFSLQDSNKYNIFSSKPLTYKYAVSQVNTKDSRAEKLDGVFNIYKCPLEGLGVKFVEEADKYGIPWWLAAAVAFKESSCGKNTPTIDGVESYNAWGWGVYGDYTHTFDNFARGIETVSKYFADRFFSQGITDPCEIMKTYTPPSDGSWCRDVIHFSELFEQFETR